MNKQLVALVNQTERYGETLATQPLDDMSSSDSDSSDGDSSQENGTRRRRRRKRRLTIEEALAAGNEPSRRAKGILTDYARLDLQEEASDFYGEATTSDSGSDESFVPGKHPADDESTLLEAEARELEERKQQSQDEDDDVSYYADPEELRKLQEEGEMDVTEVIERLRQEAISLPDVEMEEEEPEEAATRRVTFARNLESTGGKVRSPSVGVANGSHGETKRGSNGGVATRSRRNRTATMDTSVDPGNDADDDGDASDVEDFLNDDSVVSDGSDEFEADDEIDDETTIAAEERLGREMSAEAEIMLLQRESEMSVDELRKMYSMTDDSAENGTLGIQSSPQEDGKTSSAVARVTRSQSEDDDSHGSAVAKLLDEDDAGEEDEFRPLAMELDDETTIEAEERLGREMSCEKEISLLQQDSEVPIEKLREMYAEMSKAESDGSSSQVDEDILSDGVDDQESGDEFHPDAGDAIDDETTIEAEERLGREMSVQDEIALLQKESVTPVEELRALYGQIGEGSHSPEQEITFTNQEHDQEVHIGKKRSKPDSDESDDNGDEGLAALRALRVAEDRARATTASRPYLLSSWVKLREYQQIGLNWLVSIQSRRLNGILADEMGLGKTLQTIALLGYLAAYKGIWGPHLVIVPTSCIVNWETEFKRFCPGLKVLCYYGSAKRRKELRSGWTKVR